MSQPQELEFEVTHTPSGHVQYLYRYKGYSQACNFSEIEQTTFTPEQVQHRLRYTQDTLIRLVDGHLNLSSKP